ncbi:2-dehydropantoate 2-reductase [Thalassotalea sp. Y01]|uniref:ketopantoate reductase family protein n=1 Tax=Thalassotalea sp. Y01 TaxID=2729613 RepID=UPI00145FA166|nr:2-dehydropantoate 2-reductase [Thalassotalea sp. Y01]NMP17528.1 2-dehydropantoate 2-reductase [Thalassotalea sp. Y01]
MNKIAILGNGAIGLLITYLLKTQSQNTSSEQPLNIRLLTRQRANNNVTLTVKQLDNQQKTFSVGQADEQFLAQCELLICCVKSYDVLAALTPLSKVLNPKCAIVLCHNGMGTIDAINSTLKLPQPILTLLTTMAAKRLADNVIQHTGVGNNHLGLVQGQLHTNQANDIKQLLKNALPCFEFSDNIITQQWLKLAINCAINPLTAISDVTNGELASDKYQPKIKACLEEVVVVAASQNVTFNIDSLMKVVNDVISKTANNSSSMREDVSNGRATEIDYINGYIKTLGQQNNIATPINEQLYREVVATSHYPQ